MTVEAQGEQGPDCYAAVMPRAAGASYPLLEKKCHCQALWEVPSVWWVPPFLLPTRLPTQAPGKLRCAGAFRGPPGTAGTSGPLAVEGWAQVPDGPRLGRLPGPAWRPEDSASASSLTGGQRRLGGWGAPGAGGLRRGGSRRSSRRHAGVWARPPEGPRGSRKAPSEPARWWRAAPTDRAPRSPWWWLGWRDGHGVVPLLRELKEKRRRVNPYVQLHGFTEMTGLTADHLPRVQLGGTVRAGYSCSFLSRGP